MLSEATSGLPGYQLSFFNHDQDFLILGTGFVTLCPEVERNWQYSINFQTMEAKLAEWDGGLGLTVD
ncbi:unnamed protein product [Urochloa humidicola]